jgi:RNA polymerase sigma factor (sigma-70 family)
VEQALLTPRRAGKPPFARVVETHGATVLRVCRALLGPVDADDAWQETFIAALRAYPDLPSGANLEAWLVTIAHRKAIDASRARQRRPTPTADLPERQVAQQSPTAQALWLALAELPEKQRQAVVFHHIAGLPYRQVAQLMDSTEPAARKAASEGVASLRTRLTEDDLR